VEVESCRYVVAIYAAAWLSILFESMVVRGLRVYAQAADAEVFRYREKGGLEVDAFVPANDGGWAAFEVEPREGWMRLRGTCEGWRTGWIRRRWDSRRLWG